MKEITSLQNDYIKSLCKLKEKKYASNEDFYLVEGKHLVDEAYKNEKLIQILSSDESLFIDGIDCIKVTYDILKKLCDTVNPQNVVGVVKKFDNIVDLKEIKSIILLDGVSDPGNLGTIIRTAAGLDIDLIVMGNDCVDLYNPKVIRATQGAIFSTKIIKFDIKQYINTLKKEGYYIYGTSLDKSVSLSKTEKHEKYGIVLGNEAQGVKKEVLELCDCNVKIDISNKVESLNVAIAGAILMYHFKLK